MFCVTLLRQKSGIMLTITKIDREDGSLVYEVEFLHNGIEYEYDIDPLTGIVLKVDKDLD